ncbi:MAG: hypothetical protein AB1521_06060 [Bacteroidota bacterium]
MSTKKLLSVLILFAFTFVCGQSLPTEYSLSNNRAAKILDSSPASNTIERILIQDGTIWLGTSKGLSKSTDNGNSWTNYYKSEAFEEESVSALAYNNGTIWAATWHYETLLGEAAPVGTGLKYSTDNGETWHKIEQPVDDINDTTIIYGINTLRAQPIATQAYNFVYDIEVTNTTIWLANYFGGPRKSTDNGITWQRVVLPPDNLDSIKPTDTLNFKWHPNFHLNQNTFSVLAVNDQEIYYGTAHGINKSTDGGISWIKLNHSNQTNPITGNFVIAMDYNEFDNSIWASTWKTNNADEYWGVSRSQNGGESWEPFLTDERVLDFGFKYYGNPGNYVAADIFAASENGVFRSNNNGTTWIAAPDIYDLNTNIALNTKHFRAVEVDQEESDINIWIGSNNGLVLFNELSGFWDGAWKVYLASEAIASSSETYAFPNPFSPDEEVVNIKYSLGSESKITIRIMDFGMNLVKTLIQNANRPMSESNIEIWDGRDEFGKIVPNGIYFYRIDFESGDPAFGKILVIM